MYTMHSQYNMDIYWAEMYRFGVNIQIFSKNIPEML